MGRKKILVLTLAITVFACLFAIDQMGINPFLKTTASKEIQEECKRLSKETGTIQVPMTGHVLKSQFSLQSVVDCDSTKGDCSKYRNVGITAIMKPINNRSDEEFIVYTKKEPPEILKSKQPYFTKGKNYEFCAVDLTGLPYANRGRDKYKIENVETIKEIDVDKPVNAKDLKKTIEKMQSK